ncbi:ribose transport system substrate-binding protein [Nonomuraea maritima]|uniref:Ribose transport system substrate-binding protein n=1 Tax=Nonomuraea maritima TaxID=683260 RepID=A0A1G9IYJ4_9ACTN|nr:substrate-binding domain-containing protein [Nonomuraea maritima]SDL30106.1 ribose transport system substrate-binding protein [Nonomuraea maritima]
MPRPSRRWRAGAAAGVLTLILAACGSSDGGSGGGGGRPYTIGLSNGFVGSEWRTQMVEGLQAAFAEYQKQGAVDELVVESADTDVNGQIQQIRNLINRDVDAIIVNPNSETALDAVFREAEQQGIQVFAIDQAVTSKDVTNVVIDQAEWARISAKWLAGQVGEGGDIVVVNGIAGHPANEMRWNAAKQVFADAKVNVLSVADGNWDQATGQQVMTNLLATYPDVDGVWTQDGMAEGVFRAVQAADRLKQIKISGEARVGFMRLWNQARADGFESIGVVNPPGGAVSALHMAVNALDGKTFAGGKINGNTVTIPIPYTVDQANFEQHWGAAGGESDAYSLDGSLTPEQAAEYFQ